MSKLHFKRNLSMLTLIIALILAALACNIALLPTSNNAQQATVEALARQATLAAAGQGNAVEATMQALAEQGTQVAAQATQMALDLQATSEALQQTTAEAPATEQPPSTEAPSTGETEPPPIPSEPPQPDLEAQIKAARILLFEDTSGHRYGMERYVKSALDQEGYTYIDVGSAQGWLKDQLLGSSDWDLIIVSSEAYGKIQGEFFPYLEQHLERGTAVVLEMWEVDSLHQGKMSSLLKKCGVEFYKDWYNPGLRKLSFLVPDHPLFNQPNQVRSLGTANYWRGDIGDLMKVSQAIGDEPSKATLLLGTSGTDKTNHGVLTECYQGRFLLQTFATHDYVRDDILRLWQNYIYYTLTNHFLFLGQ
ncbi:MAG: hypothetical protein DDG59_03545 [Anaerolineae bacterium]|jgi:hypothetical protein|nr:MAG: hypothetical protein DDG59_03545 [Anaerolineae bacterium]